MPDTDDNPGDRAVRFCESLHLVGDYWGQPLHLRDWQRSFVRDLFGTQNDDGTRQYRKALYLLPRAQAKTALCAAIVLWCLIGAGKSSQEIYSCASSRDQAARVFDYARGMIQQSRYLRDRARILENKKEIIWTPKGNRYRALSSQASTAHGLAPNVCVVDEGHTFARQGESMVAAIETGMGKAREPLLINISTAGNRRQGYLWDEVQYARKVLADPSADPTYLPVIYEYTGEDIWNEENWATAMPALGDFCSIDFVRNEAKQAKLIPTREAVFRQTMLNQFTEMSGLEFIPMRVWDECKADYTADDLIGQPCWAGVDIGLAKDLTSLCLLFETEGKWRVLSYTWIAEEGLAEKCQEDGCPYLNWVKTGNLVVHPGSATDFKLLRQQINEINLRHPIRLLGADPWNAAQLCQELESDGIPIVSFRQGFPTLSPPTKQIERWLLSKDLEHNGDPVLRWAVGNTRIESDPSEHVRPSKIKSTGRIDPFLALCLAAGIAIGEAKVTLGDFYYLDV